MDCIGKALAVSIFFKQLLLRRDLSRVLSAKCNRFAYTYNKQGFLCKFSLLTPLMTATEPIPVPEGLRKAQTYPRQFDEAVPSEICCGQRTPPAGTNAGTGIWSGKGLPISCRRWYNGISFDGLCPYWDSLSQRWGHDCPAQPLDTLSSQRAAGNHYLREEQVRCISRKLIGWIK